MIYFFRYGKMAEFIFSITPELYGDIMPLIQLKVCQDDFPFNCQLGSSTLFLLTF